MIELFLDYLQAINSQDTNPALLRKLQESNPIGRTALLIYDKESGQIAAIGLEWYFCDNPERWIQNQPET